MTPRAHLRDRTCGRHSALFAVLQQEPGYEWLIRELAEATSRALAAPTALQLSIVAESRAPNAVGVGGRMLRDARREVIAFDVDLAARAVDGWRRFGKGRHPAQLNFGDCCTYALAERIGNPMRNSHARHLKEPGATPSTVESPLLPYLDNY